MAAEIVKRESVEGRETGGAVGTAYAFYTSAVE
jgi:hypothetical protein